jgi:glutamate synthase (NADPH/NADH) small chain
MANMTIKRTEMPIRDAGERCRDFHEVTLGYTKEMAMAEAERCLNCKNRPCVSGCPVNVRIPEFIEKVRLGDFEGAYDIISYSSSLPAVCGRVCPQENQCEKYCVRSIKGESVGIGRLERFVADYHNENVKILAQNIEKNGKKVAIVGSGPSGLACAFDLARLGYSVTVFEALHTAGGVLVYGIPEFRLPKKIVLREIENLKSLGVEFMTNVIIGKTLTVDELFLDGYNAVYIASGAGLPRFMGIEGEALKGVYSANEFLTRSNLMKAYLENPETPIMKGGRVAVVGGGNVAMDAARTAMRLGAEKVYIVYRRSMDELPARREEVEHAIEEGIEMCLLTNPKKILGYTDPSYKNDKKYGFVSGIECVKMELGEPDERGRCRPVELENSSFVIDCDTVIMSIGTSPNPLIKDSTDGLLVNERGGIIVDEKHKTSRTGVYAGGDAVTGAATVISAMGAGKAAAVSIDEYLRQKND